MSQRNGGMRKIDRLDATFTSMSFRLVAFNQFTGFGMWFFAECHSRVSMTEITQRCLEIAFCINQEICLDYHNFPRFKSS